MRILPVFATCFALNAHAEPVEPPTPLRPDASKLEMRLNGGAGVSTEPETGAHARAAVGADLGVRLPKGFGLAATFEMTQGPQQWHSEHADAEGSLQALAGRERAWIGQLGATWEVTHLSALRSVAPHLRIDVGIGANLLALENPFTSSISAGPRGELALRVWPAHGLQLRAGVAGTPAFLGSRDSVSVLGLPKAGVDAELAAGILFGARRSWGLELQWRPQWILFERTTRISYIGSAAVSFAI